MGQAVHTGNRVKDHAKLHNTGTAEFVQELGTTGLVDLFLVLSSYDLHGLSQSEFLNVLEQYLFFYFFPSVNKIYVATKGVPVSPENLQQQRVDKKHKLYVYELVNKVFILLHIFDSRGMAGIEFGFNRLWVKSLQRNSKGWFRDTLLFTSEPKPDAVEGVLTLEDLKLLVQEVAKKPVHTTGLKIVVTNTETGEIVTYGSKAEAAKAMKADESTFHGNRTKPFRRIYNITMTTKNSQTN